MKFEIFSKTKIGQKSDTNQDFFLFQKNRFGQSLFVIADGVGAYKNSQAASQISCYLLLENFLKTDFSNKTKEEITAWVKNLIQVQIINELRKTAKKVATTLSLALCVGNVLYIFHVGNTRIYQKKNINQDLFQLTRDHVTDTDRINNFSWMEKGNFLKNSINNSSNCYIDEISLPLETSLLLFSTDGLHDFVSHLKITETINDSFLTTEEKLETLFNSAIFSGSHDDISAFIVKIDNE